jgi:hypothetical protein
MSKRIPTYFSHSYRPEDSALNQLLWQRFARRGFYFTVDPGTELSSHTHLEAMMLRSSAFVAVVNYRPDNPPRFCSSFVHAELGLAVQSKTPKLVLVDARVAGPEFARFGGECLALDFPRPNLGRKLEVAIDELAQRALRAAERAPRPRNNVALLVPDGKLGRVAYGGKKVREAMIRCAELQGMRCVELTVPTQHNTHFASTLDEFECVVLDVRGNAWLSEWVFAYLYGRFVPSVKLVHLLPNELATSIRLPPLVRGLRMADEEPGVESVIYWRDESDLVEQLSRALKRVGAHGTELRSSREAATYFGSLGRRPGRVFVSNSGDSSVNEFADELCQHLLRKNIEVWQYKQPDAIRAGTPWPETIRRELEQCNVFVALLDGRYPRSKWCQKEMQRARERHAQGTVGLLPYQFDSKLPTTEVDNLIGELHAPPIHRFIGRAHGMIVKDVDMHLRPPAADNARLLAQPRLLGASREVIIDALRHVPPARYHQLLRRLDAVGLKLKYKPERLSPQPRHLAASFLRAVQESTAELKGNRFSSTTSALVGALAQVTERRRKSALAALLGRMEATARRRLR